MCNYYFSIPISVDKYIYVDFPVQKSMLDYSPRYFFQTNQEVLMFLNLQKDQMFKVFFKIYRTLAYPEWSIDSNLQDTTVLGPHRRTSHPPAR